MHKIQRGSVVLFIVFVQFINCFGKSCENHSMRASPTCGANETCSSEGICVCLPGYKIIGESCKVVPEANSPGALPVTDHSSQDTHSSNVAAGIFVPLTLIVIVIAGVYLVRKYQLIAWARNRINQRRSNYDEVMIGQVLDDDDDPPLH